MASSLPVDISILEDQVIEVTEMEDAMEECMMFVKKLSETSLTEMEQEKQKLQELLGKAEKEMKNMKQALKRCCAKRDEWREKCLAERDGKTHSEKQLKDTKQRLLKSESAVEEQKNAIKTAQQQKHRITENLKEIKERLSAEKSSKEEVEDRLSDVQKSMAGIQKENESLRKKLHEEGLKFQQGEHEREDQIKELQSKLATKDCEFESSEKEHGEKVRLLEEKLSEAQKRNKSISNEAEQHISELEQRLENSGASVNKQQKNAEEIRKKLEFAEKEVKSLEAQLSDLRVKNEVVLGQKDQRVRELTGKLKDSAAEISDMKKQAENDKELVAKLTEKVELEKAEKAESKSWATMMDEEALNELEQRKYNRLSDDYAIMQKQFAHLKKHRNQILRENNELHYHVQMATLQLASGNARFRQQMEQFRMRLQVAENMYEEKVLECNALDSQLKQIYTGEVYTEVYPGPAYV